MADTNKFSLDVSAWCEQAKNNCDEVLRKVALEVFSEVIDRTPVKTGRAKGNWNASVGAADASTSDNTDPTGAVTKAKAEAKVASAKFGDEIFLSNALPYIGKLERGSSTQAPTGMVAVSVLRFQNEITKAESQLKNK